MDPAPGGPEHRMVELTVLDWWSQPRAAEGSTASQGIRRQLGKPRLDPLTVLIRETAQNSCDAVIGDGEIEFSVHLRRLSGRLLNNWRDLLLPEPAGSGLGIADVLASDPIILTISDRGTSGLGGPLRADEIPAPGERSDFVNFVRNVGDQKSGELSGGSYGFGKGILYNISRCHVVVADSVCNFRGQRQRRLIGAALGDSYQNAGRLYTGRHWLALHDSDRVPAPLLDDGAAEVAQSLALPKFAPDATGTTVAIVGADLGTVGDIIRDSDVAANYIVSTMLWNLWPRMLRERPNRLVCSVSRDGFRMEVPNPEDLPLLSPFVDAYRQVVGDGECDSPQRKSHPRNVGRFSLRHGMAPTWEDEILSAAAPFEGNAHHCARMRQADLVVDYVRGDAPANERLQYGAVFRASAEANEYFAEAEPPTHDEWVLNGLSGTARGVVQLAQTFVRDKMKMASAPVAESPAARLSAPLGHFAASFAGVIVSAAGESATAFDSADESDRTRRRSRKGSIKFVQKPTLLLENGAPVILGEVEISGGAEGKVAWIEALLVTDEGVERDRFDGPGPVAIGWTSVDGQRTVGGPSLPIDATTAPRWQIRVRPAPDTVTRVLVRLSEDQQ